jgi:DNA-binding FadR family transcriptional regulator
MAEVLRDLRGAVSVGDAEAARAIMEQHVEGFAAAQPAARRATAAE